MLAVERANSFIPQGVMLKCPSMPGHEWNRYNYPGGDGALMTQMNKIGQGE